MRDYYETCTQRALDRAERSHQGLREEGAVRHACPASGGLTWMLPCFFEEHWDDRHDCEE